MSEVSLDQTATLGELADEPVEQTGPTGDFVYIDISSIDRITKRISDPKPLTVSQAPSRAKQVLKAGDVLVSMTRPNLNAVALVPEQLDGAIGSTGFHVLRSRWLNPNFLFALVQTQSFVDAMSAVVQGALYPAVRPRDIAAFTFSFETPAQQTRIVAKLEELLSDLDAGVAELKAAQKKLAQYRQSLLKAAVEGALTAEWRAARQNAPLPNPSPARGEGLKPDAALSPLPPGGGGAGGEGAKALQSTTPIQLQRARALRREQTPSEHGLWQHLRAKRFEAFKFRRQQPLGRYIVDFVCFEKRLIIELDGGQHADQQHYDSERDAWLKSQDFSVLRFWNNAWLAQPEAVLERIWQVLHDTSPPLPNPSPARGEGLEYETGAQLLARILTECRARWEAKQLARFKEQGKPAPRDWQKKYPEPVQPESSGLPELPEGWVWASGEQLCEFITKGTTPPKDLDVGGDKTIPFLRVTNLTDRGDLNLADKVFVSLETHEGFLSRSMVYPSDVLMNIVGPPLGQVAVVPPTYAEWNINQAIAIFRAVEGVLPRFICRYLLSPVAQHWLKARSKTTAGQTNLTLEVCRSLPFPLPPQDEQQALVDNLEMALNAIADQGQTIDQSLNQSSAQRQNLLRAAFSGQLVPQDANDEPASVLLARIRAERAAREAVKKPRGRKTQEIA